MNENERKMWEQVLEDERVRLMLAAPQLLEVIKKVMSWPSGIDPELVRDCERVVAFVEEGQHDQA